MSNSAAARPSSGGTGIRSFFSKLRKPSDLQMSATQLVDLPVDSPIGDVLCRGWLVWEDKGGGGGASAHTMYALRAFFISQSSTYVEVELCEASD
uniref:Uncharacterized protein n=1 Tax=Ascaris lumbricoides TaxID=6252 RepID=A0A0M3HZE4_ASCLU